MNRGQRIPSVDGLRALAVCSVLIGHGQSSIAAIAPGVVPFLPFRGNGVVLFFAISGYLITRLLRLELERTGSISLKRFYLRRTLRIFPAFYGYILAVVVLAAAGVLPIAAAHIVSAGTFTWNYSSAFAPSSPAAGWYLGHFWSLALEEQFYLLWPMAVLLLGMKARKLAIAIVILSPVSRVLTYVLFPELRGQIALMLHTAADGMMFGCVAALSRPWTPGRLTAAAAAAYFFVGSPLLSGRFHGSFDLPLGMSFNALSATILLLYFIAKPGGILNARPVVFVGTISYGLYLWQQLFLGPLNHTWTGVFPVNFAFCFAAAVASYYAIERPFLRIKTAFAADLGQRDRLVLEPQR